MGKKINITDFFNPFARVQSTKRPLPDEDLQDSEPARKSRSRSPISATTQASRMNDSNHSASSPRSNSSPSATPSVVCASIKSPAQSTGVDIGKGDIRGSDNVETAVHLPATDVAGSQGPLPAKSQRVVKNGQTIIKNSDDDGSDSDSSLGDIDDILKSRRQQDPLVSSPLIDLGSSTPSFTERSSPDAMARTRARIRASARSTTTKNRSTKAPSNYKFDLGTLVQHSVKHEMAEANMSKAREALASVERRAASKVATAVETSATNGRIDNVLITTALRGRGEPNEVEKLMMAINRTEALEQENSWSFFEDGEEDLLIEQPAFPTTFFAQCPSIYQDNSVRQQAFLGGYVTAMASKGRLPDEIVLWLIDAACFETREDLRLAYSLAFALINATQQYLFIPELIPSQKARSQIKSLVTPEHIDALFLKIKAKQTSVNVKSQLIPVAKHYAKTEDTVRRPLLESLLSCIHNCAPWLSPTVLNHSICLLCRLFVDQSIARNAAIIVQIEDTIESLFNSFPEETVEQELCKISSALFTSIPDIHLRSRLVHHIPAFSSSMSLFRRRLSLSFCFDDAKYLSKASADLVKLSSISYHLTQPSYAITKETDFRDLAAKVALLNIGVDNADPPHPGINIKAERYFDESIDMLANEIKSMNDRIVDTGASHMRRTQAKQVLESFYYRLVYALRTRPPKKTSFLDDSDEDSPLAKQKDFMKKHLTPVDTITRSPSKVDL